MRIAFAVNDINTEQTDYTTTHLAMAATDLGHEVWYVNVGDFVLQPDNSVFAWAHVVPMKKYRSAEVYLRALQDKSNPIKQIKIDEMDILMLRNDPNEDTLARPWARLAGINFGRIAVRHGVLVLNDPYSLGRSLTKLYLQDFPDTVRPATLITRNRSEVKAFIKDLGGYAILKPLSGSGGRNVFLAQPEDAPNINQMFEAISREGYVIVQEYLTAAIHGDTRLFVMNGEALCIKGKYAAIHRIRKPGDNDLRSNLTAGATLERTKLDECALELAATLRPKLIEDGIFFAGLDIVDNKLTEINIFSPGGLVGAECLEGVPFHKEVIHALERKIEYKHQATTRPSNIELATL